MENAREFYDEWSVEILQRDQRERNMRWKARVLLELCEKCGLELSGRVVEIGSAEGRVLAELQGHFPDAHYVAVDLSRRFVEKGRELYPDIEFRCADYREFLEQAEHVDTVLVSDLLEHVPSDDEFMAAVAPRCDHMLVKMPIEECVYDSSRAVWMLRRLVGKTELPPDYGPEHPDGHLRGYTVGSARDLLRRHGLKIRAEAVRTIHRFYGRSRALDAVEWVSARLCVALFGGAYFAVCDT